MFEWTQKRIEWYDRAVAWTGYGEALAACVRPYIGHGDTVCDLGCGTGYLALELGRQGLAVSAVDFSREAMDYLKGKQEFAGPGLEMLHSDWADISHRRWDNVIMCLTGSFDKELDYYLSLCNKRLIVIGKRPARGAHPLQSGTASWDGLNDILRAKNLAFGFRQVSVELGQPLKSIEEAEEYLADYGITGEARLSALKMLEPTGDKRYAYYLPYKRELGVWAIEKP